jgi:hypothetical protein
MRTRLLYSSLAAALAAALSGCALDDGELADPGLTGDPSEEVGEDTGIDPNDAVAGVDLGKAGQVRYVGARVLAAVRRPNAAVVRFLASENGGGVGCDELVPADGVARAARAPGDRRSCLELYLDLTERSAPVPAELVASSEAADVDRLIAGRAIVDVVPAPLQSSERFTFSDGDQDTTPHSCAGDLGSAAHFASEHCDSSGGSGVIEYCDNGQWWDLYRTTAGASRRHSFTEILSCTALADVIHEYWNGTSWPNVYTITNVPGDHYHWSHWEGDANWQRRVHTYRVFASGFFRSHTVFWNN